MPSKVPQAAEFGKAKAMLEGLFGAGNQVALPASERDAEETSVRAASPDGTSTGNTESAVPVPASPLDEPAVNLVSPTKPVRKADFGKAQAMLAGLFGAAQEPLVVEEAAAKAQGTSQEELEPGWAEATDTSGNVYFYHTSTGETTWEKPLLLEKDKMKVGLLGTELEPPTSTTLPVPTGLQPPPLPGTLLPPPIPSTTQTAEYPTPPVYPTGPAITSSSLSSTPTAAPPTSSAKLVQPSVAIGGEVVPAAAGNAITTHDSASASLQLMHEDKLRLKDLVAAVDRANKESSAAVSEAEAAARAADLAHEAAASSLDRAIKAAQAAENQRVVSQQWEERAAADMKRVQEAKEAAASCLRAHDQAAAAVRAAGAEWVRAKESRDAAAMAKNDAHARLAQAEKVAAEEERKGTAARMRAAQLKEATKQQTAEATRTAAEAERLRGLAMKAEDELQAARSASAEAGYPVGEKATRARAALEGRERAEKVAAAEAASVERARAAVEEARERVKQVEKATADRATAQQALDREKVAATHANKRSAQEWSMWNEAARNDASNASAVRAAANDADTKAAAARQRVDAAMQAVEKASMEMTTAQASISSSSVDSLPAGWRSASSGSGSYYYNETTGETSWEFPLPNGWSAVDDGSGRVYYANASTGESAWDRPGAGVATDPAAAQEAVHAAERALQLARAEASAATDAEAVASRVAMEAKAVAEAEESKATSSSAAADQAASLAQAAAAREADAMRNGAASQVVQIPAPGWAEMRGAMGAYYVNEATGESAWERPLEVAPSAHELQAGLSAALQAVADAEGRAQQAAYAVQQARYETAEAAEAEARAENEAQSSRAAAAVLEGRAAATAAAAAQAASIAQAAAAREAEALQEAERAAEAAPKLGELEEGWDELSNGQGVYYIHRRTGTTTWTRPVRGRADTSEGRAIIALSEARRTMDVCSRKMAECENDFNKAVKVAQDAEEVERRAADKLQSAQANAAAAEAHASKGMMSVEEAKARTRSAEAAEAKARTEAENAAAAKIQAERAKHYAAIVVFDKAGREARARALVAGEEGERLAVRAMKDAISDAMKGEKGRPQYVGGGASVKGEQLGLIGNSTKALAYSTPSSQSYSTPPAQSYSAQPPQQVVQRVPETSRAYAPPRGYVGTEIVALQRPKAPPPPPGRPTNSNWQQVHSPQGAYFYNRITGATSWSKPA